MKKQLKTMSKKIIIYLLVFVLGVSGGYIIHSTLFPQTKVEVKKIKKSDNADININIVKKKKEK